MPSLAQTVAPERVVKVLREEYGFSQDLLAKSTGATVRTVRNWERTGAIKPRFEQRLADLRDVVVLLEDSLTAKGIGQWFRSRHRLLGGRTAWEALSEGDYEAVRDTAAAYAYGTYV